MVGVDAGVKREKFVQNRSEHEQVALADVAFRIDRQLGTQAAQRQAPMQAVDMLVADRLEPAQQALADLRRMLVVVARQVVGFEDHLERVDVGQRQVVERHVADQFPEEIAVQRRRVARRRRGDIAETEELRRAFAGDADIAQAQPLGRFWLVQVSSTDSVSICSGWRMPKLR